MRVVLVSPWGSARCGLRTYTRYLVSELARYVDDVWVVPHYRYAQPDRGYVRWLADRILMRLIPDVVHVQHEYGVWNPLDPSVFLEFLGVLRRSRARVVVTMHSTGFPVEAEIAELADAVVVHNRHMLSTFQGRKEKVFIIPHGCRLIDIPRDVARRVLGVKPSIYLVGVFGFIDWRKGHDVALKVFREVKQVVKGVEMVFVGGWHTENPTPYMQQVIARARELGVRLTGYVSDEDFEYWMAAVDVVLHPARVVSESGVVCAALGAGKPVVTTDHPALQDKPVIRCGTVDGMVEALQGLTDPKARGWWGSKAREYAVRHSWGRVAGKHVELYERLLTASLTG